MTIPIPIPETEADTAQEARQDGAEAHHAPEAPNTAEDAPGAEDGPLSAARKEAAGYRRRLRDAEAERDQLRTALDAYRRTEAENLAAQRLASGSDLWAAGVELGALLGDDGALDPAKVETAVAATLAQRPHWRRPIGAGDGGARTSSAAGGGFDFADTLRRAAG